MTGHTSGKWELSEVQPWEIWVGADKHIASVHGQQEIRSANAKHICKCVNGRDELVKALEGCSEIFPEGDMSEMDSADFVDRANRTFVAAKKAKQALAKAKE